jgi:undecaprenyl-diphosphatase
LAGLGILGLCMIAVRNGTVSSPERSVFRSINDLPAWMYRVLWIFQQFGNVVVALVVVVVIALALRRWRLAVAAVVVVVLKLGLERLVKKIVERQRPATSIGHIHARGVVSQHGLSFVSGHSVMVTALALVLTPALRGRWRIVPWAIVVLNGVARIYVGAHNPLDVVGGAGLGLFIGGLVNAAISPD